MLPGLGKHPAFCSFSGGSGRAGASTQPRGPSRRQPGRARSPDAGGMVSAMFSRRSGLPGSCIRVHPCPSVVALIDSRARFPPPWDQVQVGDVWPVTCPYDPAAPSPWLGVYPTAIQWFEVNLGTITRTLTVGPASANSASSTISRPGPANTKRSSPGTRAVCRSCVLPARRSPKPKLRDGCLPDRLDQATFGDA